MAGHSKWSNIKHRKGRQDALKGKVFSKHAKEIAMIARSEPDPEKNPALLDAIERAKAANVPKDNIERALKRARGELPGQQLEELTYEGFGPFGVAVMVRTITDNKNRAVASIRKIFSDFGGNLEGSVAWMFDRKGSITIKLPEGKDPEEILMEAIDWGVEDMEESEGTLILFADPDGISQVKASLEENGYQVEEMKMTFVPQNTVPLEGADAVKIVKFMEQLEDNEDVHEVYANFDVPEEVFAEVG